MPSEDIVQKGLSLIENDGTKVLGLKVGDHGNVQPGQFIAKAGKKQYNALYSQINSISNSTRCSKPARTILSRRLSYNHLHDSQP